MSIKHILVVEHDENTIEFLKDQLGQDYQILLIPFGERAIQIAKQGKFDLAIVSQSLPDINGLDVLRKFRITCPSLPIILINEAPTKEILKTALQLGAKKIFEKPINENEFLSCIKNVIKSGDNGKDECRSIKSETELKSEIQKFFEQWRSALKIERKKGLDAAKKEYEQTAALYKEVFVKKDCYENWTELERENIEEIFLYILNKLSFYYCHNGKFERAINLCNTILEKDNCREDIYRRLMKCYYNNGQRDKALEQYQKCVEVLKSELQVAPMNATIRLYEQIKKDQLKDEQTKLTK